MKAADEVRWRFEQLMRINKLSVNLHEDGNYDMQRVRDMWTAYQAGVKTGIDLAPAFVAEKLGG